MIISQKNKEVLYIILANIIPIVGCFYYKWGLFNVMFYYWIEVTVSLFFALIALLLTNTYSKIFESTSKSMGEKILAYFTYSVFWLALHIPFVVFTGMFVFIFFHPVYPGWYIPNDVFVNTFRNALSFIYFILALYTVKFIQDLLSKKLLTISKNKYQNNLYLRGATLMITLFLTGLLIYYIKAPPIIAIFIFITLRIYLELKYE